MWAKLPSPKMFPAKFHSEWSFIPSKITRFEFFGIFYLLSSKTLQLLGFYTTKIYHIYSPCAESQDNVNRWLVLPINPSGHRQKNLFQMSCSELNPHPKWNIVLRLKRLISKNAKVYFFPFLIKGKYGKIKTQGSQEVIYLLIKGWRLIFLKESGVICEIQKPVP